MNLDRLIDRLDEDEELTDSERREIYFSCLSEQAEEEREEREND